MREPRRSSARWAAAAIAIVVGSGCALGPDYRRPPIAVPPAHRGDPAPDVESLADLEWWEMFDDPVLQDLVADALAANHDLKAAAERVEQVRQQVVATRSAMLPQLELDGDAARQRVDLGTGKATFNRFTGTVNLAWEIDLWGRIRRSTEAARARFWAAEDVRRGVVLSLVSEVAAGYFDLLELDAELAIARDSARTYRETADLFDRRFRGGIGTLLEVSRARAAVAAAEAEIPELERQILVRENALSVLAARPPGPVTRGRSLAEQTLRPSVPAGLPSQLLERRPDLLRAEQDVVAANAEAGAALAAFFPRFGLTALYGGQSDELDSLVRSGADIWSIGAATTAPLFQGGRILATYRAADSRVDETVEIYQQTALRAFAEVSDLLVSHEKLALSRRRREARVEQLRISVDLSLQRYTDGIASYLDVLDAQQLFFPAQVSLARTRRDQLATVVGLYRALGGGWSSVPPIGGAEPVPLDRASRG